VVKVGVKHKESDNARVFLPHFIERNNFKGTLNLKPRYLRRMGTYSLGDALKLFLKQSRLKGSIQALQINDVWEQIMGKTISKYTEKIQIHGHTLYVTTTVAPLKQELLYQKEKIKQRVNEALGENVIKEVVIN
jgi:predicted nucleic acid-binding Zn ribbon protein